MIFAPGNGIAWRIENEEYRKPEADKMADNACKWINDSAEI